MDTLLREILTSRVYEVARETPLDPAPRLSRRLDNEVLLKREDLQPIFSFKIRGAYNRIARLSPADRARGVIAASAGNHAQGVAFSARRLGLRAVIVMPRTTPEIKVEAVKALGAEVVLAGDRYAEAQQHSEQLAAESGLVFIHPFDDPLVIAGQGTVARRDAAAEPGPGRRVRAGRRRRTDRRDRRLHQGAPARRPGDRRRAGRRRRDGAVAGGRAPRAAGRCRVVRGRGRGPAGRRAHLPDRAGDGGRDHPRQQRRDLRRDQGHLRRHPDDRRAGRRAGARRAEVARREPAARAGSGSRRC